MQGTGSPEIDLHIGGYLCKQPVLAIETDGYAYHKKGTEQYERDEKKNHILEVCGVPLIRLKTNESNERARIRQALGLSI